jgi:uncharacterized membrane protein YvbJ
MQFCKICGEPASHYCVYCGDIFYCAKHACHHIGTLPETLPPLVREEMQKREKQEKKKRDFFIAVAVLAALALLVWLFSLFPGGTGTPEP